MGLTGIKLVSGGQTGADRAALDFAITYGIPHGGWCPKGRKAEDGPIDARYHLQETASSNYVQRTEWNIRDSDGSVVFSLAAVLKGGSKQTVELARQFGKPCLHLSAQAHGDKAPGLLRQFIRQHGLKVLNVAGPRASEEREVGDFVGKTLMGVWLTQELPSLTQLGFLPPGTYNVLLTAVQEMFAGGSPARERLWQGFIRFVGWATNTKAFQAIEIGGSFLTAKSEPSDIDVALEFRSVTEPVASAWAMLKNDQIEQIKAAYGVQVIVKQLNSEPYQGKAAADFRFESNKLASFRTLKPEERALVVKAERRYPRRGQEFKGVVRIEL